jgi:hypothetical protein
MRRQQRIIVKQGSNLIPKYSNPNPRIGVPLAVTAAPLETVKSFDAAEVITASSAHFVHDLYSSFLAPLLPVLIESLSLTKTAAGLLSVFYQWPSLLQPLIGHRATG